MEMFIASVVIFGGNFAPRNFLFCAGQLLPIRQYTAVFSLLGVNFGGDGTVTFGLPDLRGRMVVGSGTGPGLDPVDIGQADGANTTYMTSLEMPAHSHVTTINAAPIEATAAVPTSALILAQQLEPSNTSPFSGYAPLATPLVKLNPAALTILPSGGASPFGVMQPYLGVNYLICMEGIFPARN
jgi:microcystin-dependent protein